MSLKSPIALIGGRVTMFPHVQTQDLSRFTLIEFVVEVLFSMNMVESSVLSFTSSPTISISSSMSMFSLSRSDFVHVYFLKEVSINQ